MKVLIVHHVEPMWESLFDLTPEEYVDQIINYIDDHAYDKIIMTTMEGDGYEELGYKCDTHEEWSYGWEDPEEYPQWYNDSSIDPADIIPANGHEFTYLYPWIKNLKGSKIDLIGGAWSACLEDLTNALDHLNIEYNMIVKLIYG